jgi:2'-5' RNA ligase
MGAAEDFRAFVALDLSSISLRRVAQVAERLRMGTGAPSATWTPAAKMHITLKFIPALAAHAVVPLGRALRPLAEGKPAPSPCALRLTAFPAVEDARVVVAELCDTQGALAALAEKVDRLTAKYGVAREERRFRPHVTLARLKLAYDARRWLRPQLTDGGSECGAASLTLYRSQLGPGGSTYVPLARYDFAAAAE